jgi:hypothetical protein
LYGSSTEANESMTSEILQISTITRWHPATYIV